MQSSSILSDLATGRNRVVAGAAARPVHVALLAAIATAGLSTTVLGQQSYSAIGGVVDEFAMPTEPASPDADLLAFLQGTGNPVAGFDQAGAFGHTFDNLPQNVVGATVSARLKAVGGNPSNDLLYFERLDDPGIWCTTIANLPEAGGAWTGGQTASFTLDLGDLADYLGRTSVIDRINADGSLDVYIQDDTAVDYLALSLTTEDRHDGGEADGCGSGTDPASPDAELLAFLQSTGPVADFDQAGFFGHTFGNLPENVVSATLEVTLAVARGGSSNDLLYLERLDDPDGVWCTTIANLPEAGGTWDGTQSATITLDLANLPDYNGRTSVIDRINVDGSLDVYIQDDTCVDSMTLIVRTANTVVSSGYAVTAVGGGTVTSDGSGGLLISGGSLDDGARWLFCPECPSDGPSGFAFYYNRTWSCGDLPIPDAAISLQDETNQNLSLYFEGTGLPANEVRIRPVVRPTFDVVYEVRSGGSVVHSETQQSDAAGNVGFARVDECATTDGVEWFNGRWSSFLNSGWRVRFDANETLTLPSGATASGDELRVVMTMVASIRHADVRVAGDTFHIVRMASQFQDAFVEGDGTSMVAYDGGGNIIISWIGSQGEAARCETELRPVEAGFDELRVGFAGLTLDQDGQSIQTDAVGTAGGASNSAHASIVNNAGTLEVRADFSALGSTDVRVDVYNAGALIGSAIVTDGNSAVAATLGDATLGGAIVDKGSRAYIWQMAFLQPVTITPNLGPFAGGTPLLGDEIHLSPVDPTVQQIEAIESVQIAGENLDESIVITDIVVPNPCPTDVDGDGSTGFSDLTSLLSNWGPCAAPCPYDLDENGTVGFSDLTTLLSSWGACN